MEIRMLDGTMTEVADAAVDALAMTLRGPVLRAEDPGYDDARVVFNGMFDRRPALIARCQGTADVVDAVRFGREHGLLVAVRGGGHGVTGNATCEAGLVVDLSPMRSVRVDAERRLAVVEAGAVWGDVDRETQAFGLAAPGGIVSHTGVAGLTLSGGIGWLRRKHGLSCDNVVSFEVVTAEGEVLTANEDSHADLYWALRGGGGNFGIVTRFEFQLHPVGPDVATVFAFHPMDAAREALRWWCDWIGSVPEEVSSEVVLLTTLPDAPALPENVRGREVAVVAAVHCGDPDEGLKALDAVRRFGSPIGEIAGKLPFRGVQQAFDLNFPNTGEIRSYWKSHHLDVLSDEAIEIMADRGANRPSVETMVFVQHLGGAISRMEGDRTSFSSRQSPLVMDFMGNWRGASDVDDRHVEWVREAWKRLEPEANGAIYLNYEGAEEKDAEAHVRAALGPSWEKLVDVKTKYDPTNFFRRNQNVPPRAPRAAKSA